MFFTPGQLMVLVIVTEFIIYAILVKIADTIKHCATAKAYRKAMEKGFIVYDDEWFAAFKQNKKEEENDGSK